MNYAYDGSYEQIINLRNRTATELDKDHVVASYEKGTQGENYETLKFTYNIHTRTLQMVHTRQGQIAKTSTVRWIEQKMLPPDDTPSSTLIFITDDGTREECRFLPQLYKHQTVPDTYEKLRSYLVVYDAAKLYKVGGTSDSDNEFLRFV